MIEAWRKGELKAIDGDLEGEHMSEPIPEDNSGSLTKLVGDNLMEYLSDDSKDMFIKFYHTECGYCKQIEPAWQELAEAVSDIPDLIIAEFNVLTNNIPGFELEGVPTLRFYSKDRIAE